ncbi:MAG: hypothetical protein AVDCRST_MAG77-3920 [uncultured Chloroflexi bacterium]|uniref:DUF5615 domain-containing protein n=1 Tax=uncultured Chloroflexota bacterium TaxID=166587 RepID=A0A6J4JLT2_9CHLR|nr:MAG: hypothetical protein AVDCRST_MAG77-3920 [uncultured Chloroflexota bacterium]
MALAFYFDHHFPQPVAEQLRARRVNVLTAVEDGAARLPDPELLDRATALARVLVTADADLLVEAAARQRAGTPFAGVVYVHQLDIAIGRCVEDLELVSRASEPADLDGQVLYLPL